MTNPIDNVIINGASPVKSDFRDYCKSRLRLRLTSAGEITGLTIGTQMGVELNGVPFDYDSTDTTTAHNGTSVLVSADGKRFKPSLFATSKAGRNLIINGAFDIWQRGTSFSAGTGNTYTADRWMMQCNAGASAVISQQAFTLGSAPVSGYEGQYYARIVSTASGSNYVNFLQRVEDVRTFAGQQITISFWAKAASSFTTNLLCWQNFGSGGSGEVYKGSDFTIGTSWQRYTVTFTLDSIAGKIIGSGSYLGIAPIRLAASNTIEIWGVQVEAGGYASAFEQRHIAQELALCKRYYQRFDANGNSYMMFGTGHGISADVVRMPVKLECEMRSTPSFSSSAAGTFQKSFGSNALTTVAGAVMNRQCCSVDFTRTGEFSANGAYAITAFAAAAAYLEFNAEL